MPAPYYIIPIITPIIIPIITLIITMGFVSQHINPLQMRIANPKTYLLENPIKKPAHAATIYDIFPSILYSLIIHNKKSVSKTSGNKGGNNKILGEHQKKAIHDFIQNLLIYNIQPTYRVVFNVIIALKHT